MNPTSITNKQLIYKIAELSAIHNELARLRQPDIVLRNSVHALQPYIEEQERRRISDPNYTIEQDQFMEEFLQLEPVQLR